MLAYLGGNPGPTDVEVRLTMAGVGQMYVVSRQTGDYVIDEFMYFNELGVGSSDYEKKACITAPVIDSADCGTDSDWDGAGANVDLLGRSPYNTEWIFTIRQVDNASLTISDIRDLCIRFEISGRCR